MSFLSKLIKGVLGIDDSAEKAARAAAQRAEAEARQAAETQKLQAANEMTSVTQIDPLTDTTAGTSDNIRRKKQTTGQSQSYLGLGV